MQGGKLPNCELISCVFGDSSRSLATDHGFYVYVCLCTCAFGMNSFALTIFSLSGVTEVLLGYYKSYTIMLLDDVAAGCLYMPMVCFIGL